MIVIHASAAVEWFLRTEPGKHIAHWITVRGGPLHVPQLFDLEVANALRRFVRTSAITATRADEALRDLADMRLMRHGHSRLLHRVWELRDHLTSYDAVYVALAEGLNAPLLTLDAKIAAAPVHHATVEVI